MSISEFTNRLVETKLTEYCERRIPIEIRNQVNLTFKIMRDKVTLIETRPCADFDDMLKALDNDKTGIFWG